MLAWSSEVPSSSRCRGMLLIDLVRVRVRVRVRVWVRVGARVRVRAGTRARVRVGLAPCGLRASPPPGRGSPIRAPPARAPSWLGIALTLTLT